MCQSSWFFQGIFFVVKVVFIANAETSQKIMCHVGFKTTAPSGSLHWLQDRITWFRMSRFCMDRTQARSQDLEKGVLFWKSEKSANDLDPNFHWSWISFTRFVRKLRRNFSESSEIQTFFPPKIRWSPKKKLKKKVFTEIETDFLVEIGDSNVWGGAVFLWGGGAIFNFSQKIGLKSTKNVWFCRLHKPMGGSSPPLATLLIAQVINSHLYMHEWKRSMPVLNGYHSTHAARGVAK